MSFKINFLQDLANLVRKDGQEKVYKALYHKIYYLKNHDKFLEKQRERDRNLPESIKEKKKAYYREWRKEHYIERLVYSREWAKKNKEHLFKYRRKWQKDNKQQMLIYYNLRNKVDKLCGK